MIFGDILAFDEVGQPATHPWAELEAVAAAGGTEEAVLALVAEEEILVRRVCVEAAMEFA
jgi:hypothetical protein